MSYLLFDSLTFCEFCLRGEKCIGVLECGRVLLIIKKNTVERGEEILHCMPIATFSKFTAGSVCVCVCVCVSVVPALHAAAECVCVSVSVSVCVCVCVCVCSHFQNSLLGAFRSTQCIIVFLCRYALCVCVCVCV